MKIIRQLASGNKNSLKSLSSELEALMYTCIKENYPGNWSRDSITRSIFSEMKKLLHGKKIHTPGNTINTLWQLHQLKKDDDSRSGDIALIMQITYHDGQTSEGVAFFESAEKDPGKNSFSILSKNRIKKIASFAHHSQVLLLDYDPISGMAFPSTAETVIGNHPHNWNSWIPFTHAVTVPANLAFMLGIKTAGLYKVSVPFSYQICYRYLYGLDLDFNKPALDTATGINTARGNPKFLILVSVAHGGSEPLDFYNINKSMYAEFE